MKARAGHGGKLYSGGPESPEEEDSQRDAKRKKIINNTAINQKAWRSLSSMNSGV
jgi:hypothetical protein